MSFDWLIIALGNPGQKYAQTRHNIGWMVGFELCKKYNSNLVNESLIYFSAKLKIASKKILLAFPTTYMNNSGEAVKKILSKYKIPADRLIVLADEYNFPLGKIHMKKGGSDGGHNGVFSIISEIQTSDFYRLRCGIGKKPKDIILTDFVLSEFNETEKGLLIITIKKAVDSIEHFMKFIPERAMSDINSGRLWEVKENENKNN